MLIILFLCMGWVELSYASSPMTNSNLDPNMYESEEMSYFEEPNGQFDLDREIFKQEKIFREIVARLKTHDLKLESSKTSLKD